MIPFCSQCGKLLSDAEYEFYTYHCEECERYWGDRISEWREGAEDAELDQLYGELRLPVTLQ